MHKFLKLGLLPVMFIVCASAMSCNAIKKEVALITDVGDIDDGSFNQTSWEAIKNYCNNPEHPHTYDYYRPFADSDYARRCAIKQAVYKGAQIIVCPGFKFAYTVGVSQKDYPNVHFVLLDSDTHQNDDAQTPIDIEKNTVCVCFQSEISGYLAGYSIAYDYIENDFSVERHIRDKYGYGFVGGDNAPGVYPYGFGFIQGVVAGTDAACKKHSVDIGYYPKLEFRYNYAKVYAQSDEAAAKVKSWYDDDKLSIKTVFPCGGKLYQSITEGVKDYNRKNNLYDFTEGDVPREAARWVGVDSDQYAGLKDEHEKKTIITSALKGLDEAIGTALHFHYLGEEVWNSAIGGPAIVNETTHEVEQREWILGLKSQFGREDTEEPKRYDVERKNYVGIPTITKEGSDVIRGFSRFTKALYDEEVDKIDDDSIVYNGDGTGLYKKIGDNYEPYPAPAGVPTFMNFSDESNPETRYVYALTKKRNNYNDDPDPASPMVTFREKYLCKYPGALLNITVID